MRWSAGRFAWAVMGVWLAACGGVSQQDFPAAFSAAVCEWNARCGVIRDEGACIRNARASHQQSLAEGDFTYPYYVSRGGSLRAGRMRFDEDRAARCVTRLRALSCDSGEDADLVFYECDPYVGQREVGQACLFDSECVSGLDCDRTDAGMDVCSAGTCAARAGPGEQPADWQSCASGLSPDEEGLCQPQPGEGDTCSSWRSCAVGLDCDSQTSTCRVPAKEGAACGPGERQCLTHLNCGDDGRCHRLANLGEACTPDRFSVTTVPNELRCKRDLYCVPGPDGRGTCGERLAAGAACASVFDCQFSLSCVRQPMAPKGVCQVPARVGAPCFVDEECAEGAWCDTRQGLCAARGKKLGDPCDASPEFDRSSCVQGFRCEEGRCTPSFGGTCEG